MRLTTRGFQVAMQALLPPEETSLAACFICSVFAGCDGMNLWNFFMRAVDFLRFCIPVLAIFLRFLPSLFPLPSHCGFLRILKYETSQTNYFSAVSLFVSAKDESPGSASPRIPPPMFTLWPSDRNITCQVYWVSYGRKSGMFALGKNISGLNVESRLGY